MTEFETNFEVATPRVSSNGIILKTLIGVLLAFMVAIPNFMQGDLFLSWLYTIDSVIMYIFASIATSIVLGIIWFTLYNGLRTDHGTVFNWILYIITSLFAGLFLGNALIFAVVFVSYYAELDATMVKMAFEIATFGTFVAVIGGVLALPRLKLDGKAIKFFKNVATILIFLSFASFILWIIGMFFLIFGNHFILNFLYETLYGVGPISIGLSILAVLAAEFMFLIVLARAKYAIDKEPKHMEFYYSIILVNAIIRIYVELFKVALKILAAKNRD